jgi:hypothetical protein
MMEQRAVSYRTPFLIVAALFVVWGILGVIDAGNIPYSGYLTDGNNTVVQVQDRSPAQAAGLEVGDYITNINGIPVEDTRAIALLGRPEIGEVRTLVVERRGDITLAAGEGAVATAELDITFAGPPARNLALAWAAFVIGLCFVGCGLLAYWRTPSRASTLLALTGLGLGLVFFAGPYFESYLLRTISGTLVLVLVIFGFAFLLHFLVEFPKPKAILQKKHTLKLLYLPAVLMALFAAYLILFAPRGTSGFNVLARSLFGLFVVLYFGLALWALIHSFVRATPAERSRYGLNLLLAGVIIGLLPVTIGSLVGILAPTVVLPGVFFYFLTMVLIPITMALAVMKSAAPAPAPTPVM